MTIINALSDIAGKMKAIIIFIPCFAVGCVTNSTVDPEWNLPKVRAIDVLSISYQDGGIGNVVAEINNESDVGYCTTSQLYKGGPSRLLASDLVDARGNLIPYGFREPNHSEDESIKIWGKHSKAQLTLRFNGTYSGDHLDGRKLKFRVVIPVQRCENDEIVDFNPDLVLVSDFKDVQFPQ